MRCFVVRQGAAAVWVVVAASVMTTCAGPQSVLDPAGPGARTIHQLGIGMYIVAGLVIVLVTVLALMPFAGRRKPGVNPRRFLVGGGIVLPLAVLVVLVPAAMIVGRQARTAPAGLTIEVTGRQFWWEVAYRPRGAPDAIRSANEVRLPLGETVEVVLRSEDVIHSFWIPNLGGKTDMIPGRVNRMMIRADREGVFRGQCAEYCGRQHALMAFDVLVLPRDEFAAWLARLAGPVQQSLTPALRAGRDAFVAQCGQCHTVRGVTAGRTGPDLTQIGARRSIGAGTLPGGIGSIAAWITGAQHLKPGNAMPAFPQLEGPELLALAAYLESLK